MSTRYLPEGRLLHAPDNQAALASLPALARAMDQETVLEGRATLCTPDHDLTVTLGPFTGVIPREETALGIREGTAREIAILSRVGKPVAFTVTGLDDSGATLLLSRRRAQELALEALLDTPAGTILPATVTHLEPFGAFVDVGCGVVSLIGIENISVSRISHPSCRFRVDQEIYAVLTGSDRAQGRVFLSHKELLGTWLENAAAFAPGMTVPGYVRSIQPYGAFIELAPNFTGLADRTEGLAVGDRVSVFLKSIQPQKMKVKLTVIGKLEEEAPREPLPYFITGGRLKRWDYSPPACLGRAMTRVFD